MITSYIIATRNPRTKKLLLVMGDDDEVAEFKSDDEATSTAKNIRTCKLWGYEVIEVSA